MVWWNQSPSDFKQPVSLRGLLSKHRRRLLALSQRNKALLFSTSQKLLKINQRRSSESQPAQLSIWQCANIRHICLHPHNSPNVPIRDVNRPVVYRPAYLHERGDLDPDSFSPPSFKYQMLYLKGAVSVSHKRMQVLASPAQDEKIMIWGSGKCVRSLVHDEAEGARPLFNESASWEGSF